MHLLRSMWGRPASFLFLAVVASGLLIGTPLVTGRVYSQADILFEHYPWAAHRAFPQPAQNQNLGDVPMIFYPALVHARRAVREGRLPLWNPHAYGGQPFIGASQSAVFSPITAIAYVVPLPDALTWMYLARLLLGGLGMFVLLGTVGVHPLARTFGGLAWLLSPFTVVWVGHGVGEASALLPWLAWATWLTCRRGTLADVAKLAAFTAWTFFTGHPETAVTNLFFCGVLAMGLVVSNVSAKPFLQILASLTRAMAGVALGVAMAAVQVVPTLEYLNESQALANRQEGRANIYVAPPETLVTGVVPNFFGHPVTRSFLPMQNRYGLGSNYAEQQIYPGIGIWLLAALGAWRRRRDRPARALVAAGAIGTALMYGMPVITDAVTTLPGFDVMALSRFGSIVTFAATWLAALAADELEAATSRVETWPVLTVAAAMAGLVPASWLRFGSVLQANHRAAATFGWTLFATGLAAATLWFIVGRARRLMNPPLFAAGVTAVLFADLFAFGFGYYPTVERSSVFPVLPEIAHVQADSSVFRTTGWADAFLPNAAAVHRLSDPRGYDGIGPRMWSELLDVHLTTWQYHRFAQPASYDLLNLLGVRYIFAQPGVTFPADHFTRLSVGPAPVWRNNRAFPRAFLAARVIVTGSAERTLSLIADGHFDLRNTVLLESLPIPTELKEGAEDAEGTPGTAEIRAYRDELVEVATSAPAPRLLVLTDNFFPGWLATIDGQPAPLLRADHALRAVWVPGGEHLVRFTYRPRSIIWGGAISVAAFLCIVTMVAFSRKRGFRGATGSI
ncbi:MAG: hypothetical protein AB7I50_05940 [Vicinamibacterales bacterium]